MLITIILSLIIQTLIINKIAKQQVLTSISIAIVRSLASFLYTTIFDNNDINTFWFPYIKECKDVGLFNFQKIGSFLYCSNFLTDIKSINLIYGCIGCFSISLLIRLGDKIYKQNIFKNILVNNKYLKLQILKNYNLIRISQILIIFDPIGISYTSALGKDLFLFSSIVSIIYLFYYPSLLITIFSLIISITCFSDRPYAALFIIGALLLSLNFPNLKIDGFLRKIQFNIPSKLNLKISYKSLFIFIIFIPISILIINRMFISFYVDNFNLLEIINYLNLWDRNMVGGILSYSSDLPFFIKYLFFWILPLPIIQPGYGSIIFGISTINYLFLIIYIFQKGIEFNTYRMKFLISIIIIFSVLFSYISFNSGVTSRYKFSSCIPPLYLIFISSNINYIKNKFKNYNE